MTYLILEYEQDSSKDQTFKDEGTHPLFYNEHKALAYVKKRGIVGKIEVYDDTEYGEYLSGDCDYDEIPEPIDVIEW